MAKGEGRRRVKFTVYLEAGTRRDLRLRALHEGVPATALVERLIVSYLKRRKDRR
jgi:hypothetical protein